MNRSGRLRVAFVADTISSEFAGGVVSARRFLPKLRERDDILVIGTGHSDPGQLSLPALRLPLRRVRQMGFVLARPNRALLARAIASVDVVHLQFPFWLSFVALDEAHQAGRPVVAAFHVQPENALLNVGIRSRYLTDLVYRLWIERYYGRAEAVLCPSAFAERTLRRHGLLAPTFVVSNGVPSELRLGSGARDPEFQDRFVILMVGRFAADKRPDLLLDAVSRSLYRSRIQVILAGAGPRESKLRARGRRLPIPPVIGFLPRARLDRLLATADLFVHCSEVELEGMAVLEAMSMGLPVLVAKSEHSAASELALDERFSFPAGDAGALAARIDALIENPAALAEARARYHHQAYAFDLDASAQKLSAIYRLVANHEEPARPAPWASVVLGG